MHPPRRESVSTAFVTTGLQFGDGAALAPSRTKKSYFRALYQRLVRTRGKNRALIAVRLG
jgi:hypothetical protein